MQKASPGFAGVCGSSPPRQNEPALVERGRRTASRGRHGWHSAKESSVKAVVQCGAIERSCIMARWNVLGAGSPRGLFWAIASATWEVAGVAGHESADLRPARVNKPCRRSRPRRTADATSAGRTSCRGQLRPLLAATECGRVSRSGASAVCSSDGHPQETWITDYDMTVDSDGLTPIIVINDIRSGRRLGHLRLPDQSGGSSRSGERTVSTMSDNDGFEPDRG